MAKRTTSVKVQAILDTEQSLEQIEAYIDIATLMVDEVAVVGTLTTAMLAELERWLTAHLIVITKERRGIEEEIDGDTRVKYSDVFGEGLQSTDYGQMVAQIDTTGTLKAKGKKRVYFKAVTSFE